MDGISRVGCQFALTYPGDSETVKAGDVEAPSGVEIGSIRAGNSERGLVASSRVAMMDASRHSGMTERPGAEVPEVVRFASEVVARLIRKETDVGAEPKRDFLDRFIASLCSLDPTSYEAMKPELRRARISPEALVDVYLPAAARELGDMWMCDKVSFTSVTVGVSRLQAILREVSENWSAEAATGTAATRRSVVLLVLPEGENHTLGAFILASKLRRLGISVCISIGDDTAELQRILRRRQVDGVLVSLGSYENLESCRNLVKTIREGTGKGTRIVLGGAAFENGAQVAAAVNADLVTDDLNLALKALGIDASVTRAAADL